MPGFFWSILALLVLHLPISLSQPVQGICPYVQTGRRVITMPASMTITTQTFGVLLTSLTIPTQNHKKPFITLASASNFASNAGKSYHLYADILVVSTTTFNIRLDLVNTTSGMRSWSLGSTIKFDYILIADTVPNIYVSNKLDVIKGATEVYPKMGGRIDYHSLTDWVGIAPFSLTLTDVRFVWAILYAETESLNSDNKFSIILRINAQNATHFKTTLNTLSAPTSYDIKIKQLKISLFIYDQAAFNSNKVPLKDFFWVVPPLGAAPFQTWNLGGWPNYNGMQTVTGLAGIAFTNSNFFGFYTKVNLGLYSVDIHFYVENLTPTIPIQRLQVFYMTISHLSCPNNLPLLDSTQSQCLSTCPSFQRPSTTSLGLTGLYVCTPCPGNCCSNGLFWNGSGCENCPVNCAMCSSLSSCVTCASGYIKDSNGNCVATPVCSLPCSLCSGFKCVTCVTPFEVGGGACVCPVGQVLTTGSCVSCTLTLANCDYCSSTTVCTHCGSGFYLSPTSNCSPCSPGCISCVSSTTCSQCLSILTLNTATQACECSAGFQFNPTSQSCVCPSGYYLNSGANQCFSCGIITDCKTCLSDTQCTNCNDGYFVQPTNKASCLPCGAGCAVCTAATQCTQCKASFDLRNGACFCYAGFYFDGLSCLQCSTPLTGCVQCSSSTVCTICGPGYYLPNGAATCLTCSSNCLNCDNSECLTCQNGFFVSFDGSTSQNLCQHCKLTYGNECLLCNPSQCVSCAVGYFWFAASNQCMPMSFIKCNDGIWIEQYEACDDGNSLNGDGCNSQCLIQTDYECLLSDKQPSGSSLCRFTKPLSIVFDSLQKEVSSNVVNLLLKVEPSTFMQLSQQSITKLLSSIQIINRESGSVSVIPLNSITLLYERHKQENKIQVTVDYGLNNLQGSELRFNIDPVSTNIPALKFSVVQNDITLPIDTTNTAVYLFGYGDEIYATQNMIEMICTGIGFLSLALTFVGLFVPAGKLVIVQALAVVQITYFSALQYQKVPITFVGLRNLIFSNGYNDQSLFSSLGREYQNAYNVMGLRVNAVQNYNISLIVFLVLPALIGGIGLLITKFANKSEPQPHQNNILQQNLQPDQRRQLQNKQDFLLKNKQQDTQGKHEFNDSKCESIIDKIDSSLLKDPQHQSSNSPQQLRQLKQGSHKVLDHKKQMHKVIEHKKQAQIDTKLNDSSNISLAQVIFERIFYENTFYGVMLTSYLGWISAFYSFSDLQVPSIVVMSVHIAFLIVFTVFFVRSRPQTITLGTLLGKSSSQQQSPKPTSQSQKLKVLRNFGQFHQIAIFKVQNPGDASLKTYSKLVLVFLIQRLLSIICIVFVSSSMVFVSAFIIVIYGIVFVLIFMVKKKVAGIEAQRKREINECKEKQVQVAFIKIKKTQRQAQTMETLKQQSKLAYFYQNYLLRQGFNFITIALIQTMYLIANITIDDKDPYEAFVNNSMINKVIPMVIVGLLALNLVVNVFWWVVEVKCDFLVSKIKTIVSRYFVKKAVSSKFMKCQSQKSDQQHIEEKKENATNKAYNKVENKHDQRQKVDQMQYKSRSGRQEQQVVNMLKQFLSTSSFMKPKQSPFIGIKQKQAKQQALSGLFRIEEVHKVEMSTAAKQLRSKLITEMWDDI